MYYRIAYIIVGYSSLYYNLVVSLVYNRTSMLTASFGCLPLSLYAVILFLVPPKAFLSSPERPSKSPQPTFMAILSLCLALWASGRQASLILVS